MGLLAMIGMLLPEIQQGRLQILYRTRPISVDRNPDRIMSVTVQGTGDSQERTEIHASWFLDATELGDLLPLADVPWVTGAESFEQTGEPDARRDGAKPHLTQSWTMPFVVDFCRGQDHTIQRPPDYEGLRDGQPFSLTTSFLEDLTGASESFWVQHRILSAACFEAGEVPGDLLLINGSCIDFTGGDLIGASSEERDKLIQQARELSLSFLYWLQTEAPREDAQGYPELRLRTDVLGTDDGLSMRPHVRESRRIIGRKTIRQQDVSAQYQSGARGADFIDSIGVGWHPIDIHSMPEDVAATGETRPFQIPLGALIPESGPVNLLPACNNIATTHMTNGCYRQHPVQWNIGEAAGALAAYCLAHKCSAAAVHEQQQHLRRFQAGLVEAGVPLYWFTDVPADHNAYAATQQLAVRGILPGAEDDLLFRPEEALAEEEATRLFGASQGKTPAGVSSRADAAIAAAALLSATDVST